MHCSLRLLDKIEEIGHNDDNIVWSSDEDSEWRCLTFESFRNFTNHSTFGNFWNFVFTSSKFTAMSWYTSFPRLGNFNSLQTLAPGHLNESMALDWNLPKFFCILYLHLDKKNLLQLCQMHICQCQSHSFYWLMNLMLDVRNDRVTVLRDQDWMSSRCCITVWRVCIQLCTW